MISALTRGTLIDRNTFDGLLYLRHYRHIGLPQYSLFISSVKLNLLPTSGLTGPESYVLPVLVITIAYAGIYFRKCTSLDD